MGRNRPAEKWAAKKTNRDSLRAGAGAAFGFVLSTAGRLMCAAAMLGIFVYAAPWPDWPDWPDPADHDDMDIDELEKAEAAVGAARAMRMQCLLAFEGKGVRIE